MTIAGVLALLVVVVAAPLNWYVAVVQCRLSRTSPDVWVLRERAVVAVTLALIVTVFALVFVNNEMKPPPLDIEATRIITRSALLALSTIPALYWMSRYRRTS